MLYLYDTVIGRGYIKTCICIEQKKILACAFNKNEVHCNVFCIELVQLCILREHACSCDNALPTERLKYISTSVI